VDLPQEVLDHGEHVRELLDQGLDEQAEPELRALLRQVERHLGPDAPDTIDLYDLLGGVLYELNRLPESEAMHREALTRYRRSLGPEDPATLASAHNLGTALVLRGEIEEGTALLEETLRLRTATAGPDDPDTLVSAQTLGSILFRHHDQPRGLALLEDTHARCLRELGRDYELTLDVCSNLAAALWDSGRRNEAAQLLIGLFHDYHRLGGWQHPLTQETRERLFRMGVRIQ
jgi:tetratricopeptide (TPR) repeat protein